MYGWHVSVLPTLVGSLLEPVVSTQIPLQENVAGGVTSVGTNSKGRKLHGRFLQVTGTTLYPNPHHLQFEWLTLFDAQTSIRTPSTKSTLQFQQTEHATEVQVQRATMAPRLPTAIRQSR